MGLSEEAKKNAAISRKAYDAANMATLTAKVKVETAEAFKAYASAHQTTVSRLLADYVQSVLHGGDSVDESKKKKKADYSLWASTIAGMEQIAQKSGVPVDDLVNGVLCEFIAKWTGSQQ